MPLVNDSHLSKSLRPKKKSTGKLEGGKTHGATPAIFPGMVLPLEPAVNFQQGFGGSKFQLRVWLKRKTHLEVMAIQLNLVSWMIFFIFFGGF